jgi:hypothetical protein
VKIEGNDVTTYKKVSRVYPFPEVINEFKLRCLRERNLSDLMPVLNQQTDAGDSPRHRIQYPNFVVGVRRHSVNIDSYDASIPDCWVQPEAGFPRLPESMC